MAGASAPTTSGYDGRDEKAMLLTGPKKTVIINVGKASKLVMNDPGAANRVMTPFFAYSFYTFELTGPTVSSTTGGDYDFMTTKAYDLEANKDFTSYLEKETLKIELLDDNADLANV